MSIFCNSNYKTYMLHQNLFVESLYNIGAADKSEKFRKLKLERLALKWRDSQNQDNCCVYAMRHMEI